MKALHTTIDACALLALDIPVTPPELTEGKQLVWIGVAALLVIGGGVWFWLARKRTS